MTDKPISDEARAEQIAKEIADAADVFLAGMEDGPVDTDERRDMLKRYANARRRLLAVGPLDTARVARNYLDLRLRLERAEKALRDLIDKIVSADSAGFGRLEHLTRRDLDEARSALPDKEG